MNMLDRAGRQVKHRPVSEGRNPVTHDCRIHETYTLFTRIPVQISGDHVLTNELWRKDLQRHLEYLQDFRLCCPVHPPEDSIEGFGPIEGLTVPQVIPLRIDRGWSSVPRNLIPNLISASRALCGTRIAHSGGAGWPFPLSYYLLLLRMFIPFKWVVIIESSTWMKDSHTTNSLRATITHMVSKFLIRMCVRQSDSRVFTHERYREMLLGSCEASLVAPAIWVDEDQIIARDVLEAVRADAPEKLRLVFPARLVADKGVDTVLRAVELLEVTPGNTVPFELDIIGSGPLAERCRAFADTLRSGPVTVRFLDPVPYGPAFFELLRGYHGVILANRQAEQPRIVFDAFAQGLACIATRTSGIVHIVDEDETALLYDIDDAQGLALIMSACARDPGRLHDMGEAGWASMPGKSHRQMHRTRAAFLIETLGLGQRSN